MSLLVTTSNVEPDIVVLHLSGSMTVSPETDALESLLLDLLGENIRKLLFDLTGIDEIEPAESLTSHRRGPSRGRPWSLSGARR